MRASLRHKLGRGNPLTIRELWQQRRRAARDLWHVGRDLRRAARLGLVKHPAPSDPAPAGPVARPGLRAGVVVNERLRLDLGYEWAQTALAGDTPPGGWAELVGGMHLVLLETVAAAVWPPEVLAELLETCGRLEVPVVVWATDEVIDVAGWSELAPQLALVLDVDATRLDAWQKVCGHDRVVHAPPVVQPRLHHPGGSGRGDVRSRRPHGVCVVDAGDDNPSLCDLLRQVTTDVHVWQLRGSAATASGPVRRARRGAVSVSGTGALGRRYRVALVPVPTQGTVAPWTALELAASGAAVVATSDVLAPYLDAATIPVSDPATTAHTVTALDLHPEWRDRVALTQSRVVFDRYSAGTRVDSVVDALGIDLPPRPQLSVSAIVATKRAGQLDWVVDNLARQVHRPLEVVLVLHAIDVKEAELKARLRDRGLPDVVVLRADQSQTLGVCTNLGVDAASGHYLAKIDDDEYYGPHYLSDLVRAFTYTDAVVVGKKAHFVHLSASGATLLRFPHGEHTYTRHLSGATMMITADHARQLRFADLPRGIDTDFMRRTRAEGGRIYSADRFNFVSYRHGDQHDHTWRLTDPEFLVTAPTDVLFYGDPCEHATV